ncbi:MAG: hypothetical protein QXJ06_00585 [Candidatus Aenigmatarchaeota archaeon]
MKFKELVNYTARLCSNYPSLGIRVSQDDIIEALNIAQEEVASIMLNYLTRTEITDKKEREDYSLSLMDSEQVNIFMDYLNNPIQFQKDGSVDPFLPFYCHKLIGIMAVINLTPIDRSNELNSLYQLFNMEYQKALRILDNLRENRPIRVKDEYLPYRFLDEEF